MSKRVLSLVLSAILISLGAQQALAMCGDVTGDGMVTSSDALSVLREAVGEHHTMMCDMCPGGTTTTTLGNGATTTTLPGSGTFTLHVAANGWMSGGMMDQGHGSVTSDPAGISCGDDCTEDYNAGQMVTLTAHADAGSEFLGWMGDVPFQCMYNDEPCSVTMSRDRDVWAVFVESGTGGGMGGGMH